MSEPERIEDAEASSAEVVELRPQTPLEREFVRCAEWIKEALDGHDGTLQDVARAIFANQAQLWGGERSCMVTQLVSGDRPSVHVWLGAGDLDELLQLQPAVAAWARSQGAVLATINGRTGWGKKLRASGWKAKHTVYEREL